MSLFPPDHALRVTLADEVHARPPEAVQAPARASYVAVLVDTDQRAAEQAHLRTLCEQHGVEPPAAGATHFRADIGPVRLKWERHGEFSGYTDHHLWHRADKPVRQAVAASLLPPGWLAGVPGATVAAAHAKLLSAPEESKSSGLAAGTRPSAARPCLGQPRSPTVPRVSSPTSGLHDGCTRFVLVDRSASPNARPGARCSACSRSRPTACMALLALPIARRQSPRIVRDREPRWPR